MIPIRKHISRLLPSDTLAINEKSNFLISQGKEIYKFGFGQSPFPVPQIVQDRLKENAHQKDYLPVAGLPSLRKNVADHYNRTIGQELFSPQNVFIGPGSKELIYLVQVAQDAPLVLPSPSWVSYAPQAVISKSKIHRISTEVNDWKLKAQQLEAYCLKANLSCGLLILNYPANPTGLQFTDRELFELAKVCRKYNLIVLSDEIYGLLSFDKTYKTIAKYYPEGTIVTTGLSKWCGAGGWRLGTAFFPAELDYLMKVVSSLASETFSAVSAPIQHASIAAYETHPEISQYLDFSVEILKTISTYCYEHLINMHVDVIKGDGGFYLFPNFSNRATAFKKQGIKSSIDMCEILLRDAHVALLPGTSFGRPSKEYSARLSFVDFDGQEVLNHFSRSNALSSDDILRLFPKIVSGMSALSSWLSKFDNHRS